MSLSYKSATAYVFADIFDEYIYTPPPAPASPPSTPSSSLTPPPVPASQSDTPPTVLEVPLGTLIECLNIFGTAGAGASGAKHKKWRKAGDDDGDAHDDEGHGGRIENFFGPAGGEKRTGMRLSYAGEGHPLTLLVLEDAAGPTATCEITTYDAEPHLELPFDAEQTALKIILKSSWLRDALSELDPSSDKLTFIGNPPTAHGTNTTAARTAARATAKPMLRIQAVGSFGSTEMDYPNDREVLETFECTRTVSFSYRYSNITRAIRALQHSTKTSLRIDEEGLLSLQFLMPSPKPRGGTSDAFIEFRCLPLDEDI
ncbi:hypothetical protein EWM64_g4118 [Hericium alpestre]|uniref:Uncharacterized protein n=1 Tax=Hericium alpestre TaxID=135208 RepID=A0A4Z0A2H5_9AGAM|nr:hypothetical protein EWM64_g4118 [Hericium alpestre]